MWTSGSFNERFFLFVKKASPGMVFYVRANTLLELKVTADTCLMFLKPRIHNSDDPITFLKQSTAGEWTSTSLKFFFMARSSVHCIVCCEILYYSETMDADKCSSICDHTIVEHIDTWIIDMIILPAVLQFDHDRFARALERRTTTCFQLSMSLDTWFDPLKQWLLTATNSVHESEGIWLKSQVNLPNMTPLTSISYHMRATLRLNRSDMSVGMRQLWKWVMFLQSKDVEPYFCDIEQLGLCARRYIADGATIDCGPSVRAWIGNRSRAIVGEGARWSTLENVYFGGGPSLINHACHVHANAFIEYEHSDEVVSLEIIMPNTPIRIVYDDCLSLFMARRISCNICGGREAPKASYYRVELRNV